MERSSSDAFSLDFYYFDRIQTADDMSCESANECVHACVWKFYRCPKANGKMTTTMCVRQDLPKKTMSRKKGKWQIPKSKWQIECHTLLYTYLRYQKGSKALKTIIPCWICVGCCVCMGGLVWCGFVRLFARL